MNGAKAVGVPLEVFCEWTSGGVYERDDARIERDWNSLRAVHAGAFYAELKAAGIKFKARRPRQLNRITNPEVYTEAQARRKSDIRDDSRRLIRWLNREPTEDRLFYVACIFAERGMLPAVATSILKSNCEPLRKALGADEFSRTIGNAFSHIQSKRTV